MCQEFKSDENYLPYPDYQELRGLQKESRLSTPEIGRLDGAGPHYPELVAVRSIANQGLGIMAAEFVPKWQLRRDYVETLTDKPRGLDSRTREAATRST